MNTRTAASCLPFRLTCLALGLVLLLADTAEPQQRKDSRLLKTRLERLAHAKAEYAASRKSNVAKVTNQFDAMIQLVERSGDLPADLRIQIRNELTIARDRFQEDAEFTHILAFQQCYETFVLSSLKSRSSLVADYDRVLKLLDKHDSRRKTLEDELEEYTDDFARFDSLKVGTTFVGYRSDFDWGPVTTVVQAGNAVRLQRVPNPPVNVDFTLRIDKRIGQLLEGTITQNNGQFAAIVEGTYDGVNLNFKMVRMKRGAPRYFEYSGQLVGILGRVHLRGIKTNGVKTTGVLTLQRQ